MNRTNFSSAQVYRDSYCSQPRAHLGLIATIERGVGTIEVILQRTILCRHDIEKINKIYREVTRLEKLESIIPERNSHLLEKIVERIERIIFEKDNKKKAQ